MVKVDKAIFPLSGDPITNGHLNIIERAKRWVKELVVVILDNDIKSSVLTMEERVEITKSCIQAKGIPHVKVDAYNGLLSDYATRTGIFHIIRGLRNSDDLEYEIFLEYGHKRQNPRLEIIYFLADPQYRTISSSIARSILRRGGQIKDYIPLQAKKAMEEKLIGQYKLIVTGGIACGKSLVSQELLTAFRQDGYLAHIIDFDMIVRNIYTGLGGGEYGSLAKDMIEYLGPSIKEGGSISQSKISKEVFHPSDPQNRKRSVQEKLKTLLNFLHPYISSLYHQELASKKGIILLNIPLAAENQMLHESNNNVLLISSSVPTQIKRLVTKRKIGDKEARLRIEQAGTTSVKKKLIEKIIEQEKVGKLLVFNNHRDTQTNPQAIRNLEKKILALFPRLKPDLDTKP